MCKQPPLASQARTLSTPWGPASPAIGPITEVHCQFTLLIAAPTTLYEAQRVPRHLNGLRYFAVAGGRERKKAQSPLSP